MINCEGFLMIRDMRSKGMFINQIATNLDVDRKTVSKWLKSNEFPKYRARKPLPSKLEPFKSYIQDRMAEGCVNAVVILDEIIAKGYTGKITILREFMKLHRDFCKSKASIRYETPAGKQAQVDWGTFTAVDENNNKIILKAFVMIMGHSRYEYVEFTEDEKLETLIGCHERAFQFFDGVPETIVYDNMRTVVKNSRETGENKWNEKFLAFAKHHNFTPIRCRPYNPRAKGKVENGVKYLRRNFWPRIKVFGGLADLNQQAKLWLDTTCNIRIHKTTLERPVDAFQREALRPANSEAFMISDLSSRKVMNDCTVSYESNFYSVHYHHVGTRIGVKDLKNGYLEFYDENRTCIAVHEKSLGKHQKIYIKKHFEGIMSWSQKKVATTAPKLIPDTEPKVHQRPLEVYESLISEVSS